MDHYVIEYWQEPCDEDEPRISTPLPFKIARRIFAECIGMEREEITEGSTWEGEKGSERLFLRPASEEEINTLPTPDAKFEVDDIIAEYGDDRLILAFRRAEKEFGDCVSDYEDEDFREEFTKQLKLMATADIMDDLKRRGLVQTEISPDGEVKHFVA